MAEWQDIISFHGHKAALLYQPERRAGRSQLPARIVVGVPGEFPYRITSHWMPLPPPPALNQEGGE